MTIKKLAPGMTVYDVHSTKMGNTTISSVGVWFVKIVSVDVENRTVVASWNSNAPRKYYPKSWSKWKAKQPVLITGAFGSQRIATKFDLAEIKKKAEQAAAEAALVKGRSDKRREILLWAAYNMLKKCGESPTVVSPMETTVFYDDADCDGTCLQEDIATELGIEEEED